MAVWKYIVFDLKFYFGAAVLLLRRAIPALVLACSLVQPTFAQMAMPNHAMGLRDEVVPDTLAPPRQLAGIGNVHIMITANAEGQMWFNQGLNLLHDFWDYESARAFEQSIRADPKCAMCYWGLYQAESFYHSNAGGYAAPALTRAKSLEHFASAMERLYIEASVAETHSMQFGPPDLSLWRKLIKKYPKQSEAKLFLADALQDGYAEDGQPHAGQKEALELLRSVLNAEPNNSAANHLIVHALEAAHPDMALQNAEKLGQLAPGSGHMVHMPGHIYFLLGDYARAEKAFAASMDVDEQYMQEQNVGPDDDWNYVHNLMYAIANLLEEGKLNGATALSAKLTRARGDLDSTLYTFSPRDSISRLDPHLPVALRTADWSEVLALLKVQRPPDEQPNLEFLRRALADFATGMRAAERRDLKGAADSSTLLDAELWDMSQQLKDTVSSPNSQVSAVSRGAPKMPVMSDALAQPLISDLSVMSLELRGSLRVLGGAVDEGKKLFAEAARAEKALGYREPPHYIRPVGESEGAVLLAVQDWSGAAEAFRAALAERPNSGFPLYGIAISSERRGDVAAALEQYAKFLDAWKEGDSTLPQIIHARAYIGENGRA